MGIVSIICIILIYGFGIFFLIYELFVKSNPNYHRLAGVVITLILFTYKIWKSRKFVGEKNLLFEKEYNNVIRDSFQYNENNYTSLMEAVDYIIINKPKKALSILSELQKEAGTVNEQYAVNFFIAECYGKMEQYETAIGICENLLRIDEERIDAWLNMGISYIMLDKHKEAIESLKHAVSCLEEQKMADDVYASLASAYVCTQNYIEAKKYIDMAYEINQSKDVSSMKELIEDSLYNSVETLDGIEVTLLFKQMVEFMGYPHRVFSGNMAKEEVMEVYCEAVQRGKTEGFVPILVSEGCITSMIYELANMKDMSYSEYVKYKIDNMDSLGYGKEIADKRFMELTQPNAQYETYDYEEIKGELKGGVRQDYFEGISHHINFCLFEIPVCNPWEVLLYIPEPDCIWEANIKIEEMIAICKYWYQKYKAVPAFISLETMEFVLPEPVPENEAFEVAKEIFAFCEDRVIEDTASSTLGELADSLRKSKAWYLWWQ